MKAPEISYETRDRLEKVGSGLVIAVGAVALAGVGYAAMKSVEAHPGIQPAPIEQTGVHQGITHNSQPGTGMLHTRSGDFHVNQK